MLRRIALEIAAPEHQDRTGPPLTNLELLARRVFREALSSNMGSQRAREMIVERLEGKAIRGEKPPQPDTGLEGQLDATERDLIESLTRKDTDGPVS